MEAESTSSLTIAVERLIIWFFKHWLIIVLIPMLLWAMLPFVAPLAMASDNFWLGRAIYTLYLPFCHQWPQRSWFFFGEQSTYTLDEIASAHPYTNLLELRFFYGTPEMGWRVAWSDRMISFYTMTPIFGVIYAWLRRRFGALRPISPRLMLILLLPLTVDGLTHMISDGFHGVSGGGFRDTNAWLAQLTENIWPNFYVGDHFGTFNWWMRLLTGLIASWGLAFWGFPWVDEYMADELARSQRRTQF